MVYILTWLAQVALVTTTKHLGHFFLNWKDSDKHYISRHARVLCYSSIWMLSASSCFSTRQYFTILQFHSWIRVGQNISWSLDWLWELIPCLSRYPYIISFDFCYWKHITDLVGNLSSRYWWPKATNHWNNLKNSCWNAAKHFKCVKWNISWIFC